MSHNVKPYSMIIGVDLFNAIRIAAAKDGRSITKFIQAKMAEAIGFKGTLG